jgi:hypothetical protein
VTRRPGLAAGAVGVYVTLLLLADRYVELPGQLVLGALTWLALLAALTQITPERRAQTLLVVAAATCGEILGSIVWGVYTYRLENLPSFVPPGHGLVYLAGFALARWAAGMGRERLLVGAALTAVLAWAVAGLTVLPRADVGGALGAVLLAIYLLRGRAPAVYAGVFVFVAYLELYGTAIGTWTWAETIPGTPVPNGNPPSGVAAGYVWFDMVALALAPWLLAGVRATRALIPQLAGALFR